MILSLFRKNVDQSNIYDAYNAIVAQSRQPVFYADWQVPDTVTGRFDMISLHLAMLFHRLKTGEKRTRDFSQSLFDLFFKDMDRSLREMGTGDMAVPKKIQKMGELFYGLLSGLTDALTANDQDALKTLLARNIYGEETSSQIDQLSEYVQMHLEELNALQIETILSGHYSVSPPSASPPSVSPPSVSPPSVSPSSVPKTQSAS